MPDGKDQRTKANHGFAAMALKAAVLVLFCAITHAAHETLYGKKI
jgi:hypothetical protein